jgi:hypothetical protein
LPYWPQLYSGAGEYTRVNPEYNITDPVVLDALDENSEEDFKIRLIISAAIATPSACKYENGTSIFPNVSNKPTMNDCCPFEIVNTVFDHLRKGTKNDSRIDYVIHNYVTNEGKVRNMIII